MDLAVPTIVPRCINFNNVGCQTALKTNTGAKGFFAAL
jgi:hypothetical protein